MAFNRKISTRALGMASIAGALVAVPMGLASGTASAAAHNWDGVAQCESGGNWNTSTGNGFEGGLQFTQSTWEANGGSGSPSGASKAEQERVAENVLASQGPGAWPVCGQYLTDAEAPAAPAPAPAPAPATPQSNAVDSAKSAGADLAKQIGFETQYNDFLGANDALLKSVAGR